jgi:hypothetical protein
VAPPGQAWTKALAVVLAGTFAAMLLPGTNGLYARTYPVQPEVISRAVAEAALDAGFEREPLEQYVPTTFSATIIYDTVLPPDLPTVNVAYSNEATLKGDADEFVIRPLTDSRQNLDEGAARAGGGLELTWSWQVEAMLPGSKVLILEIQPLVLVNGRLLQDVERRNKPIPVEVEVNRNQKALDDTAAAIRRSLETPSPSPAPPSLDLQLPGELTVGRETEVSAALDLGDAGRLVSGQVVLPDVADDGITVYRLAASNDGRSVWTVEPDEPGSVALEFAVELTSQAGERALSASIPVHRELEVEDTWFNRLTGTAGKLTVLLGLVAAALALWDRRRRKRKSTAGAAPPGGEAGGNPA